MHSIVALPNEMWDTHKRIYKDSSEIKRLDEYIRLIIWDTKRFWKKYSKLVF